MIILLLLTFFLLTLGFSEDLLVKDIGKWINNKLKSGETYIRIPEGTYYLKTPIRITRSNVIIEGVGNVVIISKLRGKGISVVQIRGKKSKFLGYTSTMNKSGNNIIYGHFLRKTEKVKYIWIYKENDYSFVKGKLKSKRWFRKRPYLRQGIYKVKKVFPNKIILKDILEIDYPPNSKIYVLEMVENIVISNITFKQFVKGLKNFNLIKFVYKNLYTEYLVDTIHVKYGANVKLKNIIIELSGRHPLNIEYSYKVLIENVKIFGSLNKGKGGNGYIRFSKTHKSILKNCYVEGIRHIVFQWASSENKIRNCILKVDINFHGGYERFNKVINSKIIIPKEHPWAPIEKTPPNAHWAPPSGPKNVVLESVIEIK